MKFRNMIFVLAVAFSVIFASMIGTSYAYYAAASDVKFDVTTSNIDTGVAVVFQQSQYINMNTGIPINESDVDTLASTSVFTINPDNSLLANAEVAINIGITELSIDSNLVSEYFKYKISCNNGTSDVMTKSGTGNDFTSDIIAAGYFQFGTLSTVSGNFDATKDYTCTLKLWLQESGGDQNGLMNKKFRGLIRVNTLFKKVERFVMEKKGKLVISCVIVLLLIVLVSSTTYAYLVGITNRGAVDTGSGMLGINYDPPNDITGNLVASDDRSGGLFTTTKASLTTGSEIAYLNMYVTPTSLTNLNISALKWETEALRDTNGDGILEIVCTNSGDFSTAEVNKAIKVVDGCRLDFSDTTFNIYIWLDNNLLNSSLSGATFGAKIGADSVDISGTY